MDDDLVNEFAIYAEDDGDEIDASQYLSQKAAGENPTPQFFTDPSKSDKAAENKSESLAQQ